MQLDAVDLRDFYRSPLGHVVRRQIGTAIRQHWPKLNGGVLIGAGFPTPYLGTFRQEVRVVGALMPELQGAVVWPATGSPTAALVEETHWPIPDNSVDHLLAVHCIEGAERVRPLLREMWRVLAPDGRLMIIAANRKGIWSRLDTTPFGQGRPFSRGQLERLLSEALFTPMACSDALYAPPLSQRIALKAAPAIERAGRRLGLGMAGVVLVEARKEVVARVGKAQRVKQVIEAEARPVDWAGVKPRRSA